MKDFFGLSWGWISAILIFVSGYPYMRAIYKRELERLVVSSWILWFGIGVLLFITSYQAGAEWKTTLFPILMGVINPAVIVVLAMKYGEYKWTGFDTSCVIVCVVTIVIWQTTQSPVLGILGGCDCRCDCRNSPNDQELEGSKRRTVVSMGNVCVCKCTQHPCSEGMDPGALAVSCLYDNWKYLNCSSSRPCPAQKIEALPLRRKPIRLSCEAVFFL